LQEGSADAVARLPVPWAYIFSSFLLFCSVAYAAFSITKNHFFIFREE
jgi:hypothetical protein